jgi:hypothetical protein
MSYREKIKKLSITSFVIIASLGIVFTCYAQKKPSKAVKPRGCKNVISWPRYLVFKPFGATHITNGPRAGAVGLIGLGSTPFSVNSCIDFVNKNGKKVFAVGRYFPNGPYKFRMYSGWGCAGESINGCVAARRAKRKTKSKNIYAKFGNTCYGPISPTKCLNSNDSRACSKKC